MHVRDGKVEKELVSFRIVEGFSQFFFLFWQLYPIFILSIDLFIHSFCCSINIFEYWQVTGSVLWIKIHPPPKKKKANQKPNSLFNVIYCFLMPRDILKQLIFNVHIETLNHQEGFFLRTNNQLTEQIKFCIILKYIGHVVPSFFDDRGYVVPWSSLTCFVYSSSLIITYSMSLSFQTLRSPPNGIGLLIHFYSLTTLHDT